MCIFYTGKCFAAVRICLLPFAIFIFVLTVNGRCSTNAHFCLSSVKIKECWMFWRKRRALYNLLVMAQLKAMSYHAKLLLCNENQYLPMPFPFLTCWRKKVWTFHCNCVLCTGLVNGKLLYVLNCFEFKCVDVVLFLFGITIATSTLHVPKDVTKLAAKCSIHRKAFDLKLSMFAVL